MFSTPCLRWVAGSCPKVIGPEREGTSRDGLSQQTGLGRFAPIALKPVAELSSIDHTSPNLTANFVSQQQLQSENDQTREVELVLKKRKYTPALSKETKQAVYVRLKSIELQLRVTYLLYLTDEARDSLIEHNLNDIEGGQAAYVKEYAASRIMGNCSNWQLRCIDNLIVSLSSVKHDPRRSLTYPDVEQKDVQGEFSVQKLHKPGEHPRRDQDDVQPPALCRGLRFCQQLYRRSWEWGGRPEVV